MSDTITISTAFDPASVTRPAPELLTYYLWTALLTFIAFPVFFLAGYLRYISLRYAFDDEGVSMSSGILFKKEVHLTYRRIQDIHVTRNLFHRWLGLAVISVQTASATSGAEMTIEGVRNPEALRDFLYSKMRGAKGDAANAAVAAGRDEDQALALLRQIRDALRDASEPATAGGTAAGVSTTT